MNLVWVVHFTYLPRSPHLLSSPVCRNLQRQSDPRDKRSKRGTSCRTRSTARLPRSKKVVLKGVQIDIRPFPHIALTTSPQNTLQRSGGGGEEAAGSSHRPAGGGDGGGAVQLWAGQWQDEEGHVAGWSRSVFKTRAMPVPYWCGVAELVSFFFDFFLFFPLITKSWPEVIPKHLNKILQSTITSPTFYFA